MSDSQYNLRVWLNEKIEVGGRGTKGKLAEFMGVRPDAITRIVNLDPDKETRQLKAHEVDLAKEFFGEVPNIITVPPIPLISWVNAGALIQPDYVSDELDPIKYFYHQDLDPNGDWIALRVSGRSMDMISPEDSILFVNRNEKTLVPNGLYIIGDGEGGATYKRFRPPNLLEPVTSQDGINIIKFDQEPDVIGRVRRTTLDL